MIIKVGKIQKEVRERIEIRQQETKTITVPLTGGNFRLISPDDWCGG